MRFLMIARLAVLLLACVGVTSVQAWEARPRGVQPTDAYYTEDGLNVKLRGYVVEFSDGSRAHYKDNGRFAYVHREGTEPFLGHYSFGSRGEVCVTYDAGMSRCDTYVRSASKMVLVAASGYRFEVTSAERE